LGHAYSALLNDRLARETGGRLLLRIEDIDTPRCTPEFEAGIHRDLEWLGIEWEQPVRRQSEHFVDYAEALDMLVEAGFAYPSFMSRGEARAVIAEAEAAGREWPRDPDGVPLFPSVERTLPQSECEARIAAGESYAWRLDMLAALDHVRRPLFWDEDGAGPDGET